jgi:hypothetical protein
MHYVLHTAQETSSNAVPLHAMKAKAAVEVQKIPQSASL